MTSDIATEYGTEYATGCQRAAAWIWWAMMCGQAPDMLQYSYRVGVTPVWVRDTDMPGKERGQLARDTGPDDFSWLTRENALQQIKREADRAREAAEFEARVQSQHLQWSEDGA